MRALNPRVRTVLSQILVPIAFVAAWLLLQLVILPRLGVST